MHAMMCNISASPHGSVISSARRAINDSGDIWCLVGGRSEAIEEVELNRVARSSNETVHVTLEDSW